MNSRLENLPELTDFSTDTETYVVDSAGNSRRVSLGLLAGYSQANVVSVAERMPFLGALMYRSSALTIASSTETPVTWNATAYDTSSMWSAGAPTLLTVPVGVTRVRLTANVAWQVQVSGSRRIRIEKVGGGSYGYGVDSRVATSIYETRHSAQTAILPVSAGDAFYLTVFSNYANPLDLMADRTWLSMEVVKGTP